MCKLLVNDNLSIYPYNDVSIYPYNEVSIFSYHEVWIVIRNNTYIVVLKPSSFQVLIPLCALVVQTEALLFVGVASFQFLEALLWSRLSMFREKVSRCTNSLPCSGFFSRCDLGHLDLCSPRWHCLIALESLFMLFRLQLVSKAWRSIV